MKIAQKPATEFDRLKALRRLQVLDTMPEAQLDLTVAHRLAELKIGLHEGVRF